VGAEVESKQGVFGVCDLFVDKLERQAGSAAVLVLLLIFVIAVGQSADTLLWFEEVITLKMASLPHWGDVWNF
jgi:hypothetical protein